MRTLSDVEAVDGWMPMIFLKDGIFEDLTELFLGGAGFASTSTYSFIGGVMFISVKFVHGSFRYGEVFGILYIHGPNPTRPICQNC